tara:strand:- start:189 stop:614 length:426 start_codon:yes stop_codon:yes gene_type:complete
LKIDFVAVDKKNEVHINSLYKIIIEREFNISNVELPNFNDHKSFVENINYRKWNLIFIDNQLIGNYYINYENYIGINLLTNSIKYYRIIIEKIISIERPLPEIKSLRNRDFLINVSPQNKSLNEVLRMLNFKHIQNTYLCK